MISAFACREGKFERTTENLREANWIDLLEPTSDEIARVTRETGLAIPTEAEISEIESPGRLATRDGVLYLSLPMVSRPESDPRAVSIGFVLCTERLITVRFATSRLFDPFMGQPHPQR